MRWVFVLLTLPAWAHDLYLMPQKFQAAAEENVLVSVHTGDSFPMSEAAPDPRRLLNGKVLYGGKESPLADYRVLGRAVHTIVRAEGQGDRVIALHTPPRRIDMDAARFEAYLREEGLDHVSRWRREHGESARPGRERYRKYAKTLVRGSAPDGLYQAPAGLEIEFVPEADPHERQAGAGLPVQLLWRGRPAAGVQVERAWAAEGQSERRVVGRTGPDGRIIVPLEKPGIYRLHAVAMERSADPAEADWETYWASLTFAAP